MTIQPTTKMDPTELRNEGDHEPQRGYRSGVYAKAKRDPSGGWGLVLVGLDGDPRAVPLSEGAVIGSESSDARVEGAGVAAQHARVEVRSEGCFLEDLGSDEGLFVAGVRARRINVGHGDIVRLGRQLGVFVERDLVTYGAPPGRTGALVHGDKQRVDWIHPVLELVEEGSPVCIEGPPGTGKRTLASFAGSTRARKGEVAVVDAALLDANAKLAATDPATWVLLEADRLPRSAQLEVVRAVERSGGEAVVVATMNRPLDRATGDGDVAPWFASLFSGRRVAVPLLDARREDILLLVGEIADRHGIARSRFGADLLEALLRAGWPSGVPQLEQAIVAANAASPTSGPLRLEAIVASLSRPQSAKQMLPSATDPALARARLEDALHRGNGSVASAARSLGMSRQAIYREADRLGLGLTRRRAPPRSRVTRGGPKLSD